MAKKMSLGSGLDDLFGDNSVSVQPRQTVRIIDIEPNKSQPRKEFDEIGIRELADSIEEHGLLQPILVRPMENGMYQIVAGERRWRACKMLGWSDKEVPVIIRELDDLQTAQIALIENLQREDLNPVDEALAYSELIEKYKMTQESVARIVGKARASVTNSMRILKLPKPILDLVRDGELSQGAAKVLLSVNDEKLMEELAIKASKGELTVRQLEKAAAKANAGEKPEKAKKTPGFYKEMEIALGERLQRKTKVSYSGGKGKLTLEFYDEDDLKGLADLLIKE